MSTMGKRMVMICAIVAMGAVWIRDAAAQQKPETGVVTVFDHEKMDASFNKALSEGGGTLLWSHNSGAKLYEVKTHSRDNAKTVCKPEGCGHTGYVAVVYVVSGAATLVVGGKAKAAGADKFGGQSIQGGESRKISKGDVFIMPPDTVHWYKNVQTPFRYLEVPVP